MNICAADPLTGGDHSGSSVFDDLAHISFVEIPVHSNLCHSTGTIQGVQIVVSCFLQLKTGRFFDCPVRPGKQGP